LLWIRDCRYIQKDIGFPSIDWHEVKRKYDRLIRTDNTTTFPQGKDYFLIICTQLNDFSIPYVYQEYRCVRLRIYFQPQP